MREEKIRVTHHSERSGIAMLRRVTSALHVAACTVVVHVVCVVAF